jgi:hypothetical protein
MERQDNHHVPQPLPPCAAEYIAQVVRRVRYRKKVRRDIAAELTAHFEDELWNCTTDEDREAKARQLIEEFGDPKLLAILCRRAKKRCRPLWRKVVVRSVQAAGIVLLYSALCSVRLLVGTPSLKVDYLAWLSAHTRVDRPEALNAKPDLDKAAALIQDEELLRKVLRIRVTWPGDMNESERRMVADLVEHNAEACVALRQAVTKPYYWVQYETAVNEPLEASPDESPPSSQVRADRADPAWAFNRAVVGPLPGYKRLSQAFQASLLWRAYQGDVSGALDDCLVLMSFGMHLEGKGTETEQLVGIALEAMGSSEIFALLDRCVVSGPDRARIESRLADLCARHESPIDVTGSRAVWLALVQQTFTDDGTGNGRVLKGGLPLAARNWQNGVASLLLFGYPDRREMISLIDTLWQEYQLALEAEPAQPQHEEHEAQWKALAQKSFLLSKTASAMDRIIALVWRIKTGRRALLTTLAVMHYADDKGVYPPTLDALATGGYVKSLPMDPYSGRAFGYRRTENGFLLYSVGDDLKDDGGKPGLGRDGQPRLWMGDGDWVFWPAIRSSRPIPRSKKAE